MFVVLLMYQKGRERVQEKKSFSQSKDQQPQHEEANIWYSSQAGLDSQLRWCKQKKVQKTALLVPVERGLENMAISIC